MNDVKNSKKSLLPESFVLVYEEMSNVEYVLEKAAEKSSVRKILLPQEQIFFFIFYEYRQTCAAFLDILWYKKSSSICTLK